jgi:WD40 repeat protein
MSSTGYSLTKITTLTGHTDRVWHCAWSPGGTALATCGSDKTIRVWKKTSRLSPRPDVTQVDLDQHPSQYAAVYPQAVYDGLLPDTVNNSIVEVCLEKTQQENNPDVIINQNDWALMQVLEGVHLRTIRSIAWSPSGRHIAAASFDHSVSIWELIDSSFELVATLRGHESEVKSVNWNQSGEFLVTSSRDKTIWIWENDGVDNWECSSVLTGHAGDVKRVAFHPHNEDVISVSYDDTLRIWQAQDDDWYNVVTLADSTSTVWDFSFTKNAKFLSTVSDDNHLRLYFHDITQPIPRQWKYIIDAEASTRPIFTVSTSNQFFPPQTKTVTIPDDEILSPKYTLYHNTTNNTYYIGLSPCFGYIATGTGENNVGIYETLRIIPSTQLENPQFDLTTAVKITNSQISPVRQSKLQQPTDLSSGGDQEQDGDGSNGEDHDDNNNNNNNKRNDDRLVTDPLYNHIDGMVNVLTVQNAHLADVNCVSWNPKIGNILATVGDDNQVILWRFTRD